MKYGYLGLILGFASALAGGQAPSVAARSRDKCSIEGKVVRAGDGAPLKKAVVIAFTDRPQPKSPYRPTSVSTDGDGRFALKDLDPGQYTLAASCTGYVRQRYGQERSENSPGTTLTLIAGQDVKDIIFRLLPGAAISGHIVDEDSETISGVRLQALKWGYRNGRRELIFTGNYAATDDRGEYRMFHLAPGRSYISASYQGPTYGGGGVFIPNYGPAKGGDEVYPPTYYPGVMDAEQASAIEIRPGDDLPGINFRLTPVRAVRITGRILKSPGGPARNSSINISSSQTYAFGDFHREASTDDQGRFEIKGVPPGSYTLWSQSSDDGKPYQARAEIEVANSDIDGILLVPKPPIQVPGNVRTEGSLDLQSASVRVSLMPVNFGPYGYGIETTLKPDFSFTLSNLPEGNYRLRLVGLPPDDYVSSATFGKRDVLRDGLSLRTGGDSLQIVVSASGGRVDGTVLDEHDQPCSAARVVLVPEESLWNRQDLFHAASSDQHGRFLIRGITPGKYRLFAWETVDEGSYYDPDFLRSLGDQGQSLEISAGARAEARVKLSPAAVPGS